MMLHIMGNEARTNVSPYNDKLHSPSFILIHFCGVVVPSFVYCRYLPNADIDLIDNNDIHFISEVGSSPRHK